MYKELRWHVFDRFSKVAAVAFALLTLLLFSNLFFSAIYSLAFSDQWLAPLFQNHFVQLSFTGLAFAFLASVMAWPFALATAVILAQDSSQLWTRFALRFFRGLAYLPSIIYGFVFCWALGPALQSKIQRAWMGIFAAENWFTELLAFAVTLIGYPLTIFSSASDGLTVDMFYMVIKDGIVDLAADGYSAFVITLSLTFFLIPLFAVAIYRIIQETQNDQYILATRALGATEWESLHLTMSHVMKSHFVGIFLFGVGKAFVEGVSIFIVLNFFFLSEGSRNSFWGETLSSYLIKSLWLNKLEWQDYFFLVATLVLIHLGLSYLRRSFLVFEGEELTL